MFTKIEVRPITGSVVVLNTVDGSNNAIYPVNTMEIETTMDIKTFQKHQAAGSWPTYNKPGAMTIHCEGDCIGLTGVTDALTVADYVTKRLALLAAVLPTVQADASRKHGVLRVKMQGMTEDADADIWLAGSHIPMNTAQGPAISTFAIDWLGFTPWFTGVSSGDKYLLG